MEPIRSWFFMRQGRQCAGAAPVQLSPPSISRPHLGAVHKVGLAQWVAGVICRLDASLREC